MILSVDRTQLRLDGAPFCFRGLSFFNALFNEAFNYSSQARQRRLSNLRDYGVTALRVWCQWDFGSPYMFADAGAGQSLFRSDGQLYRRFADRLCALAKAAEALKMVLEITLFSQERIPRLPQRSMEIGTANLSSLLRPHRNVLVQIWNECDEGTERYYEIVKGTDAERVITSCPGFSGDLGSDHHNRLLDVLTPHTVRQPPARFWVDGPRQVGELIVRYAKPVIDDEPARCGVVHDGGIVGGTTPAQHIAHRRATEALGGYYTYHHDMFQGGYGDVATSPDGIPGPEFSLFHRAVFAAMAKDPYPTGASGL